MCRHDFGPCNLKYRLLHDLGECISRQNVCAREMSAHRAVIYVHAEIFCPLFRTHQSSLQGDIKSKLNSSQYAQLDRQKRQLFSRYLTTCNSKGTVFLDVISKKEYDPLGLANRGLKTTVPTRTDPTKLVSYTNNLANKLIGG